VTAPSLEQGWVASELAEEFPALGVRYLTIAARPRRSPEQVRYRLRRLADRITGGHVIQMRQDTVPWAYRVFWRQVGVDPDTDRTPVERLALERLVQGGLQTRNLVDDAIAIATLETGVATTAFDADRVEGALGLRLSEDGEPLGDSGPPLGPGRIVFADERRPLAVLGGDPAEDRRVARETTRIAVAALYVKGVPMMSVDEALWTVEDLLSTEA
jgi:DNA/RNA-binding domain of Phe-tRNA-synthetase-like protein